MTSPPVWSFGRSQRSGLVSSATPGPGAYTPFCYHSKKPQTWKIGTERKIFEYSNYKPGPGQYNSHLSNINKKEAPHYKFGTEKQLKKQKNTNLLTPGAGTYNPIQKTLRQPDYSFGFKDSKTYESIGPGPAHYNGNGSEVFNITRRPTSKIGTSQRSPLNYNTGTPGPDRYDYVSRPQTAGPKHKFGSSIRDQMLPDSYAFPGPGAYDHKTNKTTTMISRREDKTFFAGNRAPGPGTYNPSKSQHLPLSKIGFSVRDDLYTSSTPGPGSYNPDMANRPRSATYKIGTSIRKPLQGKGKDTPGPGNYEMKSKLTEAPQYFMARKYPGQKIEGNPGPGHYEPLVTQTNNRNPQQIIGTSLRPGLTRDKQIPGPGQYDIRKGIDGPFISIGNALRNDETQSYEDPGPGAYDIPPKFADIPKYAMANSAYKSSYN